MGGEADEYYARQDCYYSKKADCNGNVSREISKKIDKAPSFIGQIERGECMPKLETLQALISCLGIDTNRIFTDMLSQVMILVIF